MTVRAIEDASGVTWQVWEVVPGSPRIAGPVTGRMPNVWGGAELHSAPATASTPHDDGWLVFMADTERRRLAPIPPDWAALDDAHLLRLLDEASRPGGT